MAIIKAPDVEALLVAWLPGQLTAHGITVPVATRQSGTESVTLFRTGGPMATLVTDQPQVTFDCRAATEGRAADIALTVRAVVHSSRGLVLSGCQVYDVGELGGPVNLPDPNFPQGSRYRWTGVLHVRAASL